MNVSQLDTAEGGRGGHPRLALPAPAAILPFLHVPSIGAIFGIEMLKKRSKKPALETRIVCGNLVVTMKNLAFYETKIL